jgi:hypothetical protein
MFTTALFSQKIHAMTNSPLHLMKEPRNFTVHGEKIKDIFLKEKGVVESEFLDRPFE